MRGPGGYGSTTQNVSVHGTLNTQSATTLTIPGELEVSATGTLNNSGTINPTSCDIDATATLTGNAPNCP